MNLPHNYFPESVRTRKRRRAGNNVGDRNYLTAARTGETQNLRTR